MSPQRPQEFMRMRCDVVNRRPRQCCFTPAARRLQPVMQRRQGLPLRIIERQGLRRLQHGEKFVDAAHRHEGARHGRFKLGLGQPASSGENFLCHTLPRAMTVIGGATREPLGCKVGVDDTTPFPVQI